MSIATQTLKYGWLALASLGVITGATIYIVNNQRKTVRAEDIAELALGVTERCLAAGLTPPSFIRTFTSNSCTSNGVSVITNIGTNIITWTIDREMLIELDTTITNLVSHFFNTNTIGSSNLSMLTVTGLWASLSIGDHTSRFTRVPSIGTNSATYGDYPWHIYAADLEERYKVLNALTHTTNAVLYDRWTGYGAAAESTWAAAKALVESGNTPAFHAGEGLDPYPSAYFTVGSVGFSASTNDYVAGLNCRYEQPWSTVPCTSVLHNTTFYYICAQSNYWPAGKFDELIFDGYGQFTLSANFQAYDSTGYTTSIIARAQSWHGLDPRSGKPTWVTEPAAGQDKGRGYLILNDLALTTWQFQYCTNKYW